MNERALSQTEPAVHLQCTGLTAPKLEGKAEPQILKPLAPETMHLAPVGETLATWYSEMNMASGPEICHSG